MHPTYTHDADVHRLADDGAPLPGAPAAFGPPPAPISFSALRAEGYEVAPRETASGGSLYARELEVLRTHASQVHEDPIGYDEATPAALKRPIFTWSDTDILEVARALDEWAPPPGVTRSQDGEDFTARVKAFPRLWIDTPTATPEADPRPGVPALSPEERDTAATSEAVAAPLSPEARAAAEQRLRLHRLRACAALYVQYALDALGAYYAAPGSQGDDPSGGIDDALDRWTLLDAAANMLSTTWALSTARPDHPTISERLEIMTRTGDPRKAAWLRLVAEDAEARLAGDWTRPLPETPQAPKADAS